MARGILCSQVHMCIGCWRWLGIARICGGGVVPVCFLIVAGGLVVGRLLLFRVKQRCVCTCEMYVFQVVW